MYPNNNGCGNMMATPNNNWDIYGQSAQYCNPMIEVEMQKSAIKINEAGQKSLIDIKKQEYLDESRANRRERMREYRDNLYDEISIENGEVSLSTRNSAFDKSTRKVCNFVLPALTRLVSSEGDEGILVLSFWLNNHEKKLWLKESKLSNNKYFLARIRTAGGEIFAKTNTKAEQMAASLMSKLMQNCEKEIIPAHGGWNLTPDGVFYFVEKGDVTWLDIVKKAE